MMSKVELATTTVAVGGELISSSNQATHVVVGVVMSGLSLATAHTLQRGFLPCLASLWIVCPPLWHG